MHFVFPVRFVSHLCLSGRRPGLSVGTAAGLADVVQDSYAQPLWVPGAALAEIEPQTLVAEFFISVASGSNQTVGPAAETHAPLLTALLLSGDGASSPVTLSHGGAPAVLRARFLCGAVGTGQVALTLAVQGYDAVSFGFRKLCQGALNLSNPIEDVLLICLGCRAAARIPHRLIG